jgi:hypothetical protein
MSLLSILTDKNFQELRDKFKTEFLRPEFDPDTEMIAPPLTNNYGIVGTSFDYLVRFFLQFHNKETFIQRDSWVADHSYKMLYKHLSNAKSKTIETGFYKDKVFKTKELLELIVEQFSQTKENYKHFLSKGYLTDELITNTIFLAKLDVYFRAGIIDQNFDVHNQDDIKDLKAIISLVNKEHFIAKNKCYFNPTFGHGSMLVGGADADLIIDNTLIDIKVTKELKLDRKHLNQVLGYYILSLIGGVNNNPLDKPIENIGIYFARHGELWTVPLIQFGNQKKFEDFKKWFIQFVTSNTTTLIDIKELIQALSPKSKKNSAKQKVRNTTKKKDKQKKK